MNESVQSPPNNAATLDGYLERYPHLSERIIRQLQVALHEAGAVTIDEMYEQARGERSDSGVFAPGNPNVAEAPRGGEDERVAVNRLTRWYAAQHLTAEQIDDLVNLALKREEADKLRAIVSLSTVSFRLLADAVRRFCALPEGESHLQPDEAMGIRVGLIRHLISDQLEFIGVAKRHLWIRDFGEIVPRVLGDEAGMGRVGGKAAGMFLASKILTRVCAPEQTEALTRSARSEATIGARPSPGSPSNASRPVTPSQRAVEPVGAAKSAAAVEAAGPLVAIPESYYLRSDVIETFIKQNDLGEYQNQKYKSAEDIRKEYRLIKSVFRNGKFPEEVIDSLRRMLEEVGTHPVIVRSSSLLEDRFGTAFSGKYASFFLGNQGPLEKRLRALLGAIAEVFASALGPDPLLYRREHDLLDYEEDMAVLIQKVVGQRFGPYFAPAFAGVAFSRNDYRWSPRIRREDGLMRIVMGLGTRAVDRVASEFPRMVALGMPTLRHESSPAEIMRRSQRTLDVINLNKNRMEQVSLDDVLRYAPEIALLDRIVSSWQDGMLVAPMGTYIEADAAEMHVTFDKLMNEGTFPQQMRALLRRLELAYGLPVDVEFAHDGNQLYLLQCRTLTQVAEIEHVKIPSDVPEERIIFSANRFVRSGLVDGIEYVIYVDPRDYDAVGSRERRVRVARVIGALNEKLGDRRFILIGPGRWGSNDMRLGVPVTYADINRSKMLIEVARERDGYVPEVSFGTHFFQDLVEARIAYLPLYPDDRRNRFNETFLGGSENALATLLPKERSLSDVVRVIDVAAETGGRRLRVVMDGDTDQALAFLTD